MSDIKILKVRFVSETPDSQELQVQVSYIDEAGLLRVMARNCKRDDAKKTRHEMFSELLADSQ